MAYGPNDLPDHPHFWTGNEAQMNSPLPTVPEKYQMLKWFQLGPDGKVMPLKRNPDGGVIPPSPQKTNQLAPDPRQRLAAALLNGGR